MSAVQFHPHSTGDTLPQLPPTVNPQDPVPSTPSVMAPLEEAPAAPARPLKRACLVRGSPRVLAFDA